MTGERRRGAEKVIRRFSAARRSAAEVSFGCDTCWCRAGTGTGQKRGDREMPRWSNFTLELRGDRSRYETPRRRAVRAGRRETSRGCHGIVLLICLVVAGFQKKARAALSFPLSLHPAPRNPTRGSAPRRRALEVRSRGIPRLRGPISLMLVAAPTINNSRCPLAVANWLFALSRASWELAFRAACTSSERGTFFNRLKRSALSSFLN
jgi:hypothetical protein